MNRPRPAPEEMRRTGAQPGPTRFRAGVRASVDRERGTAGRSSALKKWVIGASVVADLLDLTGVGHLAWFVDVAVVVLHFAYAGPRALIGILDLVPGLGLAPIFTVLALFYDHTPSRARERAEPRNVTPGRETPPSLPRSRD